MFLVDSNVGMQVLRDRAQATEAQRFLTSTPPERMFVTDFTVYFIGILLHRYGQLDRHEAFPQQSRVGDPIRLLRAAVADLLRIPEVCKRQRLDFDDAYRYLVARRHGLTLVRQLRFRLRPHRTGQDDPGPGPGRTHGRAMTPAAT